jgi:cytochrome P450
MAFIDEYDSIPATDPQKQVQVVYRWLRSNWRGMYGELRAARPVFRTPAFVMVTRRADVIQILSENELYSVRGYKDAMDPSIGPFMLDRDGTAINWNDKGVMRAVLPWDDLPGVRSLVEEIAGKSLAAGQTRIELVSALGRLVPLKVVQRYFGFPGPDDATMLRWSKATQWDIFHNPTKDAQVHAACVRAGEEMRAYVWGLLDAKRGIADPPRDPVARLAALVRAGGAGMTAERAVSNVCGLLVGAIETTAQAIVQATEQILIRPDVLRRAADVAGKGASDEFEGIVWEALRFNPITTLVFRYCERDTVIAAGTPYETPVTKGTVLAVCLASAMFDEAAVPDAEEFRDGQPFDSYLHFGFGNHECLGKYVGKVMIPEAVRQVVKLPGVRPLPGDEGKIDFQNGPFPERYLIAAGAA